MGDSSKLDELDCVSVLLISSGHVKFSINPKTSPRCKNVFLLSPGISEFRFPVLGRKRAMFSSRPTELASINSI